MQYLIKYALIECAIWWTLEEWHEEHACQVLWIYHAHKRRYWFIIIFIIWKLQTKRIGIKENLLHERGSFIWEGSNKIYFIFFTAVFYLIWIFKFLKWISKQQASSGWLAASDLAVQRGALLLINWPQQGGWEPRGVGGGSPENTARADCRSE
jgi:hypothetical protein